MRKIEKLKNYLENTKVPNNVYSIYVWGSSVTQESGSVGDIDLTIVLSGEKDNKITEFEKELTQNFPEVEVGYERKEKMTQSPDQKFKMNFWSVKMAPNVLLGRKVLTGKTIYGEPYVETTLKKIYDIVGTPTPFDGYEETLVALNEIMYGITSNNEKEQARWIGKGVLNMVEGVYLMLEGANIVVTYKEKASLGIIYTGNYEIEKLLSEAYLWKTKGRIDLSKEIEGKPIAAILKEFIILNKKVAEHIATKKGYFLSVERREKIENYLRDCGKEWTHRFLNLEGNLENKLNLLMLGIEELLTLNIDDENIEIILKKVDKEKVDPRMKYLLLKKAGHYEKALQELEKVTDDTNGLFYLKRIPNPTAWITREKIEILRKLGRNDKAKDTLKEEYHKDPIGLMEHLDLILGKNGKEIVKRVFTDENLELSSLKYLLPNDQFEFIFNSFVEYVKNIINEYKKIYRYRAGEYRKNLETWNKFQEKYGSLKKTEEGIKILNACIKLVNKAIKNIDKLNYTIENKKIKASLNYIEIIDKSTLSTLMSLQKFLLARI